MNPQWHKQLFREIALAGLPLSGIVDIELAAQEYATHFSRYESWIERGYAGEMGYLLRGLDRRRDPRNVFPEAISVLSVALPYSKAPHGETNIESGVQYARYLRDEDYHDRIPRMLESAIQSFLKNSAPPFQNPFKYKICVDTSAILERSWAALSGLGWIGKNKMLIHPQFGSYLLLGEVLINQPSGEKPKPIANYCGSCSRCITQCPTRALSEGELNSNRCISYWTLEKRGELKLSESDRSLVGNWVAGCDLCQEICPFNHKAKEIESTHQPAKWQEMDNEALDQYKERTKTSALNRVKPEQFKRNLTLIRQNLKAKQKI